jgi:anti-anti-sigma regulatory factor
LHEGGLTLRTDTVAEVDAAGIQLLVSLAHECRARGLWLKLGGISPALDAALRVTGLAPFFTHAATAMEVAP